MKAKMLKTTTIETQAYDIPTMQEMSLQDYQSYLDGGLLFLDHHGILRSEAGGGYPLATSKEQIDALLTYIKSIRHKIGRG